MNTTKIPQLPTTSENHVVTRAVQQIQTFVTEMINLPPAVTTIANPSSITNFTATATDMVNSTTIFDQIRHAANSTLEAITSLTTSSPNVTLNNNFTGHTDAFPLNISDLDYSTESPLGLDQHLLEPSYNSHVIMVPLPLPTAFIWDNMLGVVLVLCLLAGVPGNIIALKYFISRKRDLPTLLYINISCVDLWTSMAHLPIAVSLFGRRAPLLFDILAVCTGWTVVFRFLQKVSIFLVMLLSVYRTVVIVFPFKDIGKNYILASLWIYYAFLIGVDAFSARWDSYKFLSIGPFCVDSPLASAASSHKVWVTTLKTLTTIELGLPAIISFFSFVVFAVKLSRPSPNTFQTTRNRKASITVAIFTGIFLACNLPFFILMILNTTSRALGHTWPDPFFRSVFMSNYSWLIAKIVLTVVNAAINPALYYFRMSSFESWMRSDIERIKLQSLNNENQSDSFQRKHRRSDPTPIARAPRLFKGKYQRLRSWNEFRLSAGWYRKQSE